MVWDKEPAPDGLRRSATIQPTTGLCIPAQGVTFAVACFRSGGPIQSRRRRRNAAFLQNAVGGGMEYPERCSGLVCIAPLGRSTAHTVESRQPLCFFPSVNSVCSVVNSAVADSEQQHRTAYAVPLLWGRLGGQNICGKRGLAGRGFSPHFREDGPRFLRNPWKSRNPGFRSPTTSDSRRFKFCADG